MNVEIGTEAAQFPEKKYINVIFVAVQCYCKTISEFSIPIQYTEVPSYYPCTDNCSQDPNKKKLNCVKQRLSKKITNNIHNHLYYCQEDIASALQV